VDRGGVSRGGWSYSLLPYIEQQALHAAAGDGDPDRLTAQQKDGARYVVTQPVAMFNCPSRRLTMIYPKDYGNDGTYIARNASRNPRSSNVAGRIDYAINCGDLWGSSGNNEFGPGPPESIIGQDENQSSYWTVDALGRELRSSRPKQLTGIAFERSAIGIKHIEDGTSNTYLVGGKFLNPDHYETGMDPADNETWCTGYNDDNYRNAYKVPLQDTAGLSDGMRFGGPHSGGFNVVFCDGSVHMISFSIDLEVHRRLANRQDGLTVDLDAF
jgi:prepilin-type processing-associated H-X9-DG protein